MRDLSARFEKEKAKVRQELNERATQLNVERQSRERDGRHIKQIIEEASIGGIGLEFIGVFYLALGIVLASAPELVVSVFGW